MVYQTIFYQKDIIGKHDNWPSIVDRNDFRIEASIGFRDCELTCLLKSRWNEMVYETVPSILPKRKILCRSLFCLLSMS